MTLNCWEQAAQVPALPTINNNVYNSVHSLFAYWRIIMLSVASFSYEEVKEGKGLVDSLCTSL